MNKVDGGPYDWFLEALPRNVKPELSVCFEKPTTERMPALER